MPPKPTSSSSAGIAKAGFSGVRPSSGAATLQKTVGCREVRRAGQRGLAAAEDGRTPLNRYARPRPGLRRFSRAFSSAISAATYLPHGGRSLVGVGTFQAAAVDGSDNVIVSGVTRHGRIVEGGSRGHRRNQGVRTAIDRRAVDLVLGYVRAP